MIFGLTEEDLAKETLTEVDEVAVHDGKGGISKVRVGDQVEIFEPAKNKSTVDYLGPGPYTITWLARWRCNREFLQLTNQKNESMGVNNNVIKIAS